MDSTTYPKLVIHAWWVLFDKSTIVCSNIPVMRIFLQHVNFLFDFFLFILYWNKNILLSWKSIVFSRILFFITIYINYVINSSLSSSVVIKKHNYYVTWLSLLTTKKKITRQQIGNLRGSSVCTANRHSMQPARKKDLILSPGKDQGRQTIEIKFTLGFWELCPLTTYNWSYLV